MTNTITVTWNGGDGKMTLDLDVFFPCPAAEIIHFDKSCLMSDSWSNDRHQILMDLRDYLVERISLPGQKPKELRQLMNNQRTIERLLSEINY